MDEEERRKTTRNAKWTNGRRYMYTIIRGRETRQQNKSKRRNDRKKGKERIQKRKKEVEVKTKECIRWTEKERQNEKAGQ